jgi:hypothetical protein
MLKKRLTEEQRLKLLEDTKQRVRLEQQARTQARLEELEIEVLENLGRQLQLEVLELSGELECPETSTARQYTRYWSNDEEDLTDEKKSSSVVTSVVEIPGSYIFYLSFLQGTISLPCALLFKTPLWAQHRWRLKQSSQ